MFIKYPRTPHLTGSRLQKGDTAEDQVPAESLTIGQLVWEEKLDGANTGISFIEGEIQLQSRGHILTGGSREAQFNMFKQWGAAYEIEFYEILGERYIMYGEWCYAKHTVFYDNLPHYFNEFDIYDKENNIWLDTDARHSMLKGSHIISVPVLYRGCCDIQTLLKPSLYKTINWRNALISQATSHKIDPTQTIKETEKSDLSEGLYIKQEKDGQVVGRYKFVRPDFLQTILESGSHWSARPILPNILEPNKNIFGGSNVS